jgi:hypothetical protein
LTDLGGKVSIKFDPLIEGLAWEVRMPLAARHRIRAFRAGLATIAAGLLGAGLLSAMPAGATTSAGPARVPLIWLPAPRSASGTAVSTAVTAVTPWGAMSGTTSILRTLPDGSDQGDSTAQRWLPTGLGRWVRQPLPQPAGTSFGQGVGLTNLAEVGGSWDTDGLADDDVAVRWPATGGRGTVIGATDSRVTAVGPDGTWGVQTDLPGYRTIAANAELVARDGTRTPIDTGARLTTIVSIADRHTALVTLIDGVGQGTTSTPAVWRDGQLKSLPVFSIALGYPDCVSDILANGSVAYSGISDVSGSFQEVAQVHRGGVPGTEVPLDLRDGSGSVACDGKDTVAADGSVGGTLQLPGEQLSQATIWRGGEPDQLPLQPGELSTTVVALQSATFAIVRGQLTAGGQDLWAWRHGRVIPLTVPSGYSVASVVTVTASGLVVANLKDGAGLSHPAAWLVP